MGIGNVSQDSEPADAPPEGEVCSPLLWSVSVRYGEP